MVYPTTFTTIMSSTSTVTFGTGTYIPVNNGTTFSNLVYPVVPNGLYIDHVRLYVLHQVLKLQSELMDDLLERRHGE